MTPRTVVALVLAAGAWGLGTVVSKHAVETVPPLTLFGIQLATSLAALALLMRARGIPIRAGGPALLGRLGVLNPGLAYALSLIGLATVSASLSVLLWAMEPLLILLLGAVILREEITAGLVGATVVALFGLGILVYEPAIGGQIVGIALTVAGVGCCAVYTVITRRWIRASDGTAQVVFAQQAYALGFALVAVLAAGVIDGGAGLGSISPFDLASAAASGLLYYAAGYWLYLSALKEVPASIAATSFYLIPIFGLAGAFLFLGERLDLQQSIGAAVVLVALVAIVRPRFRLVEAAQPGPVNRSTAGTAARSDPA